MGSPLIHLARILATLDLPWSALLPYSGSPAKSLRAQHFAQSSSAASSPRSPGSSSPSSRRSTSSATRWSGPLFSYTSCSRSVSETSSSAHHLRGSNQKARRSPPSSRLKSAPPNIYESAALVKMQIAGIKGSLPCEACDGYPVGPRLLESTRSRRKHLFAYWGHD